MCVVCHKNVREIVSIFFLQSFLDTRTVWYGNSESETYQWDFIHKVSKPAPALPGPVDGGESSAEASVGGKRDGDGGLGEVTVTVDVLTQESHLFHSLVHT